MVSPARRLNLDDTTPTGCTHNKPLDSSGCSQDAGAAANEIDALFNDAYKAVQNMGEVSTATKDASTSTRTACPVVSEVEEHVEPVKVSSRPVQPKEDKTLDDVLGSTTQKSDGR